jgi:uncharacterized protein (TIGR02246 family)
VDIQTTPAQTSAENEIRELYQKLIDSWNRRNAAGFAALFTDDSNVVGFDGSQMNGSSEIATTLSQLFADHVTAPYIAKIRDLRFLTPEVAILRAVVGMIPPGQTELNPAVNSIQTLIALKQDKSWKIALFQNTPAQFHGRPDLAQQLTDELRQLL